MCVIQNMKGKIEWGTQGSRSSDLATGGGTWDLRAGTWDLGPRTTAGNHALRPMTWDLDRGPRTWEEI